ncbi:hypothetical protein [Candidatus Babela massiliensis]|uniref:Uncharacterized protein n=1 Tax=Candidatus Babela massiliensis TaxID=673862 RepID=V6DG10_9BACT|nr:hypothetical protein [Candidatus Babela massiliensis]CDK30479.1 hypothetical protein BABL1_gene_539 [Candidatus Babela massiliensis]
MNNLKKTMLALSLLIPVNSAFAISWSIPTLQSAKDITKNTWNAISSKTSELSEKFKDFAFVNSSRLQDVIKNNSKNSAVLAVIATGLTATGIAYNKNTKFNRAVNDKLSPVKRFANNKLAAIQNKYADLKEKYNVTDAQEAKAKKVAKYTALAGASTAAVWGIANIYNKIKNK